MKIEKWFNEYQHNRPIIYACLEGQYAYELIEDEGYVVLLTQVDYHYVAGQVPSDDDMFLSHITDYIKKHQASEFVLFAPNKQWEDFLASAFQKINGIIDARYLYKLDEDKYDRNEQFSVCEIEEIKSDLSRDLLLQANIKKENQVISAATALMIGDQHAEIDVYTEEQYRGNGLAYKVSKTLIDELLKRELRPNWCCWRIKESSQKLAKKLGFVFALEIPAYVWVKGVSRDLL